MIIFTITCSTPSQANYSAQPMNQTIASNVHLLGGSVRWESVARFGNRHLDVDDQQQPPPPQQQDGKVEEWV